MTAVTKALQLAGKTDHVMGPADVELTVLERFVRITVAAAIMSNRTRTVMAVLVSYRARPVVAIISVRAVLAETVVPMTITVLARHVVPMGHVL